MTTAHTFNVDDAVKYGVDGAIMLNNFRFWIAKNKANQRHFHQGRYWTYNSAKAFTELFPYWSASQIRRILAKLIEDGALITGDFNANPYDHTKWYALNENIDLSKSSHRLNENVKSTSNEIDTSNTDTNTDKKPYTSRDSLFDAFWQTYPKKVGKDAARKAFEKRRPDNILLECMLKAVKQQQMSDQWAKGFIPNPATWLNEGRWQDEVSTEQTIFQSTNFLGGI